MEYLHTAIHTYLKDLGSKTAAPGGGSAAGLAAAMASSVVEMAVRYTRGKDGYQRFQRRLEKIHEKNTEIQRQAFQLCDEDVKAYLSGDAESAIQVPAKICFLSYDLAKLADELIDRGNRSLVSDAVLALMLAETAFLAALGYVQVNIGALKDKKTKRHENLMKRLKLLEKALRRTRKEAEVKFGKHARRQEGR